MIFADKHSFCVSLTCHVVSMWCVLYIFDHVTSLSHAVSFQLTSCQPLFSCHPHLPAWPQSSNLSLFLLLPPTGVTLNWGVMIAWSGLHGSLELPGLVLYLSCLMWTIIYDTIYSHQVSQRFWNGTRTLKCLGYCHVQELDKSIIYECLLSLCVCVCVWFLHAAHPVYKSSAVI